MLLPVEGLGVGLSVSQGPSRDTACHHAQACYKLGRGGLEQDGCPRPLGLVWLKSVHSIPSCSGLLWAHRFVHGTLEVGEQTFTLSGIGGVISHILRLSLPIGGRQATHWP